MTLIDTPGIGALSANPSASTVDFLAPGEGRETAADAVLYLMKHLHATDVDFLAAFHDEEVSQATPVNAVAVLVACGRGRWRPARLARVCRDASPRGTRTTRRCAASCRRSSPWPGSSAQTGVTLRQAEYAAIATLARSPVTEVDAAAALG